MDWLALLLLALIQGLTEFLPISSSGHLLLVPVLTDWPDQGLVFDLAVHLGTLLAVVLYFRRELLGIAAAMWQHRRRPQHSAEARLGWAVLLGTIPVGLCGLAFKPLIETTLRQPQLAAIVIALSLIGFGLLLGWADWGHRGKRDEHSLGWRDVAIVGLAQALALIPGTSRSGITITAGLMIGLSRQAAARFSFLLSIPVIVLASGLQLLDIVQQDVAVDWLGLSVAAAVAGLSAYASIHAFLALLARIGMQPFVAYRVVLGVVILMLVL
jgi:undecaprenyl-diphosphatase